jgi:hypothetical protein
MLYKKSIPPAKVTILGGYRLITSNLTKNCPGYDKEGMILWDVRSKGLFWTAQEIIWWFFQAH